MGIDFLSPVRQPGLYGQFRNAFDLVFPLQFRSLCLLQSLGKARRGSLDFQLIFGFCTEN